MWVDYQVLAEVIPRRTLFWMISERKVKSRTNGQTRYGKPVREVDLFSLPMELQEKALRLVTGEGAGGADCLEGVDLAAVPDHHLERTLLRISACREASAAPRGEKTAYVKEAAERAGITTQQLYRDLRRYRKALKSGENLLSAMLPKWKGSGKPKALPDDLAAWAKAEYLKPTRPSAAKVHRQLCKLCKERGVPESSYATVRRLISEIPEAAKVRHRKGKEAWRKTAMPKIKRDYEPLRVNEIWCGDHHQLDLFIRHRGRLLRPWVTAWMDLKPRTLVGLHVSVQPNSWTIALALRHAILPKPEDEAYPMMGVPERLYIDNGKDYRSQHLGGASKRFKVDFNRETRGVLEALRVQQVTHAKPYTPWSKTVERWFGTLERDLIQELPGWCGNKPSERPEKLERELAGARLLSLEEVREEILGWVVREYHGRAHHGQGMGGRSPLEVWSQTDRVIREFDPKVLDLLLMKAMGRTIHTDGIRLHGYRYWSDELAAHVGERVNVRYSPEDVGEILVFHGTNFLCKAREAKLYSYHAEAEDLKAIQAEQRRAERVAREFREIQSAKALEPDDVDRHFARQERLKAASARREAHEKQTNIITRLDAAAKKVEMAEEPKKPRLAAWPHELEEKSA